jgi:hypothetical protein
MTEELHGKIFLSCFVNTLEFLFDNFVFILTLLDMLKYILNFEKFTILPPENFRKQIRF